LVGLHCYAKIRVLIMLKGWCALHVLAEASGCMCSIVTATATGQGSVVLPNPRHIHTHVCGTRSVQGPVQGRAGPPVARVARVCAARPFCTMYAYLVLCTLEVQLQLLVASCCAGSMCCEQASGATPLYIATLKGHREASRVLAAAGAVMGDLGPPKVGC
jgi:hypothetical protein